jgi:hypothetical protein
MIEPEEAIPRLSIALCHHGRLPKGSRSFQFSAFRLDMVTEGKPPKSNLLRVMCVPPNEPAFKIGWNNWNAAAWVVAYYMGAGALASLEAAIAEIEDGAAALDDEAA